MQIRKSIFWGDSITEGRDASCKENGYVSLLQKKYPNATIRNYGAGGSCLSDKCLWGVRSFRERAGEMDVDAEETKTEQEMIEQ